MHYKQMMMREKYKVAQRDTQYDDLAIAQLNQIFEMSISIFQYDNLKLAYHLCDVIHSYLDLIMINPSMINDGTS